MAGAGVRSADDQSLDTLDSQRPQPPESEVPPEELEDFLEEMRSHGFAMEPQEVG
jgi:hypothetical protein